MVAVARQLTHASEHGLALRRRCVFVETHDIDDLACKRAMGPDNSATRLALPSFVAGRDFLR